MSNRENDGAEHKTRTYHRSHATVLIPLSGVTTAVLLYEGFGWTTAESVIMAPIAMLFSIWVLAMLPALGVSYYD